MTHTRIPRPHARNNVPSEAVVLPLPFPVFTITSPCRISLIPPRAVRSAGYHVVDVHQRQWKCRRHAATTHHWSVHLVELHSTHPDQCDDRDDQNSLTKHLWLSSNWSAQKSLCRSDKGIKISRYITLLVPFLAKVHSSESCEPVFWLGVVKQSSTPLQ